VQGCIRDVFGVVKAAVHYSTLHEQWRKFSKKGEFLPPKKGQKKKRAVVPKKHGPGFEEDQKARGKALAAFY